MLTLLQAPPFEALVPHLSPRHVTDSELSKSVGAIVNDVRIRGDAAVRDHTRRVDGIDLAPDTWEIPRGEWQGG
ncbi:MAG TPA: hypothetical protein VN848_07470, partial [Gemmatimonadales bacterium]|nr:hypothetical protein [Gemmatimonadales bacterium]